MFEAANSSELRMLDLDASPRTKEELQVGEKQGSVPPVVDPEMLSVSTRYWPGLWTGGED